MSDLNKPPSGTTFSFVKSQQETLQAGSTSADPPKQDQVAAPEQTLTSTLKFVETHCGTCAAGWVRTSSDGKKWTFCLLDREKVSAALASCSRYERREDD